ncbi:MAG TPA: head GIN domain-containing protein [Chitinophagaceae bacterium]|nr:head GIN domain-containing protein [Chitinophagaceae bacterium]
MRKFAFLMALAAICIAAPSCDFVGGERVRGNGNMKTENRQAAGFTGISSHGSFDVFLDQGTAYSIRVEADENLLPYIETEVRGNSLEISTRDGYSLDSRNNIRIYVTAPAFNTVKNYGSGNILAETKLTNTSPMEVDLTGSGDIRMDVNAPDVSADLTGSGVIDLNGETRNFSAHITGSGDIKAGDLKAENADIEIMGSGSVDIYASVKLQAGIRGSGDIRYRGTAEVNKDISGSGNVRKID